MRARGWEMRKSDWLAATRCCALIGTMVACSDSLGPEHAAQRLAGHFDSLWVAANSRSAGNDGYAVRASTLTLIETPLALGASPTSFAVITSTGAEQWRGVMWALSPAEAFAQPFSLFAYRDSDAHTFLFASFHPDGSVSATMITNDSVAVFDSRAFGAAAALSSGRTCVSTPGLENPGAVAPSPANFSCTMGRFTARLALDFPSREGMDPALTNLSFGETAFNGVQLTRRDSTSHP